MPNNDETQNPAAAAAPVVADGGENAGVQSDVVVTPVMPAAISEPTTVRESRSEIYTEIARKISEAHNILIALSGDPSVDEMAAAIGLSLYLDRLGKRATAIYSGSTPNALEFLKPEETFESTADALQDFVIALNKEKADHLRYKLDGDYVKIYITPYRTRIAEEDLDFSYGDFNVDLVLALDVANGVDLDSALREHGRIMHSASVINITTGNPGKFGEIEWSDKSASSVSEMIAGMLYGVSSKIKMEKEEATAFLTGIVAATNRFSNASTTPATMRIASKLMESGANQQLVSKNITPDVENEIFSVLGGPVSKPKLENDPTKLNIDHGDEIEADESKEVNDEINEKESTLLDELKAAEASLAQAGAEVTPDESRQPIKLNGSSGADSDTKKTTAGMENIVSDANVVPEMNVASETGDVAPIEENLSEDVSSEPSEVKMPESQKILEVEEKSEDEDLPLPILTTTAAIAEMPSAPAEDKADNAPVGDATVAEANVATNSAADVAKAETPKSASETAIENGVMPEVVDNSEAAAKEAEARVEGEASYINDTPEKVIQPSANFEPGMLGNQTETERYGKMLEDAISDSTNIATASAPAVASAPEINGVPEINYMPMPGTEVLPPPPAPPIDMNTPSAGVPDATAIPALPEVEPIMPAAPAVEPNATPLGANPAMQDQVYNQQMTDPSAFRIPGM